MPFVCNRLFTFCLWLFLASTSLRAQPPLLKDRITAVENNLIPYVPVKGFKGWNLLDRMQYYNVPGLSIAVIKDFKIDWAKGYGYADTVKKTRVTTSTLFSAGSISKFVTAVAALDLVQKGKLLLDSPINNYLHSWKVPENEYTRKTPVTLRMLLSHTAGISQSSYFGFTPDKTPLPSIVDILNGTALAESRPVVVNSKPLKEFRYSGGGSMIAQQAIMDVTGQDFAAHLQQAVFNKVGMRNSTFSQPLPAKYKSQASWAYSSAPWFKGMPYVYPQQAAAGLYTTPTDLAKFFIDVQKAYKGTGKILKQKVAKEMLTPQVAVSDGGYKEQIGIGPFLLQRTDNKEPKGVYFEFTGVNAGFLAYGIASLTDGNGVIIMLNSGDDVNGLGKEVRRAVAKVYNWYNFLPEEITPLKLAEKNLDEYTGRYRRSADEVVYLRREKDYLVQNINEGTDIYCFPVGGDSVVFTDFGVRGGFQREKNGKVISLQTVWQDKPMPKLKDDELTPGELLRMGRCNEAKEGYRQMNLNEYGLTYLAYELLNRKPARLDAAKAILELAAEKYPTAAIVFSRWGDYYRKVNNRPAAIRNYQKALALDPTDQQSKELLKELIR